MTSPDNTPILIGAGQATWRETDASRTPVDALHEAGAAALADCGTAGLAAHIDTLALVRFIADANPGMGALFPRNPGRQLAKQLNIREPALYQGVIGGNTPQYLVNVLAKKLAAGEHSMVLLAGAELLATLFSTLRSGEDITSWVADDSGEPITLGHEREGLSSVEMAHGLYEPINTYPLFENSLQHHLGNSAEQHLLDISTMCSRMSQVAADNPYAWHQNFETPEQVATVVRSNRIIGYPYTRSMNPVLAVDQSAAVVMTTVGKARALGIDPARWIYLRGGADVNDIWHVSERPTLHSSPAIAAAFSALSRHARIPLDEIGHFDIYSCFPSAVEIACREIGLSPMDARGVTVTGGLPYFGGPGNNYSLHGIAQMSTTLRASGGHGLVTANGLYLTKHSMGLYSTEPAAIPWQELNSAALQQGIDDAERLTVASDANGIATVESYTVGFDREGPKQGIIIARNARGERIIANTNSDSATLEALLSDNPIGHTGKVRVEDGINILTL